MATGARAHFDVAAGHRSGLAVKTLVEHVDEACREAGLSRWSGQMNAREGRRETVLVGYGFVIHSKTPNRTLSWLAGSDVSRLTVAREVGALQRAPDRSRR